MSFNKNSVEYENYLKNVSPINSLLCFMGSISR